MKLGLTTDKIVKIGVILLLTACISSIIISIYHTRKIKDSAKRTNHAQQVLLHAEKIVTLAVENETGSRGYIISGKKSFLEPIENSQKEIYAELAFLKSLASTVEINKNMVDSLSFYIDKRIFFSKEIITAFDLYGRKEAMTMVETGKGKFYTDQIRLYADNIQAAENILLSHQKKINDKLSASLMNTLLVLAIAVLVMFIILLLLIRSGFSSLKRLNKDIEKQVHSKAHELHTILERITDAFVALDKNWCYTYMNKKAGELMGINPEKMIGKNVREELTESAGQSFRKACEKAMAEQEYIYFGEYHPHFDKWFESHIYPSSDGLSIFFRDITEKKKAEEALNDKGSFIESIINASADIIYIYDIEERKNVYVNKSIQSDMGYTDVEIKQMGNQIASNLMHPDDLVFYINTIFPKYLDAADKEIVSHEYRVKNKSGNWCKFSSKESVFLRKDDGTPKQIFGIATNITEIKNAEDELRATNLSLSEAQRIAKMGSWTYSLNGELKWSDNMYQLYGLASKVTTTTPAFFFELVFPDDREKMQQWMQSCLAGETPGDYEFRSLLADGSIHYYRGVGEVKYDKENVPVILHGTVQDITEQKKAEHKLLKSEELFSGIFNASPAGIVISQIADGKIINANESFYTMFEFSPEEVIGQTSIDLKLVSSDERAKLMKQQTAHGRLFNGELLSRTKSGKSIHILFSSKQLDIESEICNITTLIDITERKKAETKLVENENYLRTILDTEPECVKVLNRNGELLSMNPAGLAMIEADNEQQVAGHLMTELVDEKYREDFNQLCKNVFDGNPGTLEFEITGLKEGRRWLETHAVPLKDEAGKIVNLLGVTRDITQRKKAEEEIKKTTEQLRQLTAHLQNIREEERKRIGREIHDELGQQLTAVKMDVAWIDKKISMVAPGTTELTPVKNKLQNIITLLDGSNESVRKILHDLRHGILEDNGLLEAMEWQGNQFTEVSGIPVQFIFSETMPVLQEPIANSLFRIYQEALTNIARHSKATNVTVSLNVNANNIILLVKDDGKGFDTATLEQNKSFGILGMKERVLSMQGQFELVTAKGKGTQIQITLPI
jgi:PAS domain S-box-containing protein